MIVIKKIKASALQFVLLIATIIAIVLASFITLTHTHSFFKHQSKNVLNSISYAEEGFSIVTSQNTFLSDTLLIQKEYGSIYLEKEAWGGYLKYCSTGKIKKKQFKKIGLMGVKQTTPKIALQVTEDKIPLYLTGNSTIKGIAYVPNENLLPGVISGNYFNGIIPSKEQIINSGSTLPKIDNEWLERTKMVLKGRFVGFKKFDGLPLSNSFQNPTEIIKENGKLTIFEKYIGNIIIMSDSEISINPASYCEDVIFVAPKIKIESGFMGRAHFIATQQIYVEANVQLLYPSSLTVIDGQMISENRPPDFSNITISSNSTVSGNIIYMSNDISRDETKISLSIKPNAVLNGSVYNQGNTALAGTVIGKIYTERFISNVFGSNYVNYIYNGNIYGDELNDQYAGLPFENSSKSVVRWLY